MERALGLGNPGRSGYHLALEAGREIFDVRSSMAELLAMPDDERLVFTSGATASLNMAIHGLLKRGSRILSTNLEHNAVARPLHWGSRELGWHWQVLNAIDGAFCDEMERALAEGPCDLVVVNHISNVSGERQALDDIRSICGQHGVTVLVDVSQSIGCEPLGLGPNELMAGGGHKGLAGPMGIGFLAVGEGVELTPVYRGGTGSASESLDMPNFFPDVLEPGTPNLPGILGLGAAIEFLNSASLELAQQHIQNCRDLVIAELSGVSGIGVIGPREGGSALSLSLDADMGVVADRLWKDHEIAVRVGMHCSPLAHQSLGTYPNGTLRVSFSRDTRVSDLEFFCDALTDLRL